MTVAYDPQKHHRRSIRLKGYDYAQAGAYYFTIVTQNRVCLFGDIVRAEMRLNEAGKMFWEQWNALPERFPNLELDEFIVMPNHIHGIVLITDVTNTANPTPVSFEGEPTKTEQAQRLTFGKVLGAWKSIVTDEYIKGVRQYNWVPFERRLLQRDYWEHIIRNDRELESIRDYVAYNPYNWETDDHNPKNARPL